MYNNGIGLTIACEVYKKCTIWLVQGYASSSVRLRHHIILGKDGSHILDQVCSQTSNISLNNQANSL